MAQLGELQDVYKDIRAEGAEMLVITSDTQAANKKTARQIKSGFPLLSDKKVEAITAYNANDPFNQNIARPQFYIIDENGVIENGVIRWKILDVRRAGRIDPAKVVAELKKL